jgi:hypothetical protein
MGYSAILVDKDNISETLQLEVSTPDHTYRALCCSHTMCFLLDVFKRSKRKEIGASHRKPLRLVYDIRLQILLSSLSQLDSPLYRLYVYRRSSIPIAMYVTSQFLKFAMRSGAVG